MTGRPITIRRLTRDVVVNAGLTGATLMAAVYALICTQWLGGVLLLLAAAAGAASTVFAIRLLAAATVSVIDTMLTQVALQMPEECRAQYAAAIGRVTQPAASEDTAIQRARRILGGDR